jgi:predicted ATP-grasp superfamily ATP-dependent carboligase
MRRVRRGHPPAIVLGLGVNGLSVARALGVEGVEVHGVWTGAGEPGRFSRYCSATAMASVERGEDAFIEWLAAYASRLDRPVVLPTSDRFALWLARHRPRLDPICRMWRSSADLVESLLNKERFHSLLAAASLDAPPSLASPSGTELSRWCADHPAPYLIKPFHENALPNPLGTKNRVVGSAEELLAYSRRADGLRGLLVQRMLRGGDGWHFSVTGLCDRSGALRALVTRRKLVQYPPDRGIGVHTRLPACDSAGEEAVFLDAARAFLSTIRYHGLFSCEWLKERTTGEIFALDFNPRSVYGGSQLLAAGVNLPHLAYRDLCGEDLRQVPERPAVRRVDWADAWGCAAAWWRLRGSGRLRSGALLRALLRSRAHAVWCWRDPLPFAAHACMQSASWWRSRRSRSGLPLEAFSSAVRD